MCAASGLPGVCAAGRRPRRWHMIRFGLALAGASLLASAALAQTPAAGSLEGLWQAKERYGPDVRSTLMLREGDGGLIAEIAGLTVPVRQQGKFLSFELADGKGSFRGTREGPNILGQW